MTLTRLSVAVIVIIGLSAAGIIFPAMNAAREQTRRTQCGDNVKELVIALQNYHDTFLYLPYGARNRWRLDKGTQPEASWGPSWLPVTKNFSTWQVHTSLYDRLLSADIKSPAHDHISPQVREAAAAVIVHFMICPSSPLPKQQRLSGFRLMVPSYAGIMGAGDFSLNEYEQGKIITVPETRAVAGPFGGTAAGNGVLLINESLTMAACVDGTANTIAIGEVSDWYYTDEGQRRNPSLSIADAGDGHDDAAGWIAGTNLGFHKRRLSEGELETLRRARNAVPESLPHLQGRFVHQSEPPIAAHRVCNLIAIHHPVGINNSRGVNDTAPDWGTQGIGRCGLNNPLLSAHPAGAMVGYMDGHAQLIPRKTAVDVLKKLAVRDDCGMIPDF